MEPKQKVKSVKLSEQEYKWQALEIFESQGWRCVKCGRLGPLQVDHIKKRSQGRDDSSENLQALCAECHEQKDNVAKSKSRYWNAKV